MPKQPIITNEQFANGLRAIADFYEAHPDMKQPYMPIWVNCWSRDEFLKSAVELAKGGRVTKSADPSTHSYPRYHATRFFGDVAVDVVVDRSTVCRLVRPAVYECPDSLLEEAAEYTETA